MPPRDDMAWPDLVSETKFLHERATTMMVLRVRTKMSREVLDAIREDGNLNPGRSGIHIVGPVLVDRECLIERHRRNILSACRAQPFVRAIVGSIKD